MGLGVVRGEEAVPKRVFRGEAVKAAAGDGDAAEVFIAETAAFDSDFKNSPPQFVWEQGHSRNSNKLFCSVRLRQNFSFALLPGKLCSMLLCHIMGNGLDSSSNSNI